MHLGCNRQAGEITIKCLFKVHNIKLLDLTIRQLALYDIYNPTSFSMGSVLLFLPKKALRKQLLIHFSYMEKSNLVKALLRLHIRKMAHVIGLDYPTAGCISKPSLYKQMP